LIIYVNGKTVYGKRIGYYACGHAAADGIVFEFSGVILFVKAKTYSDAVRYGKILNKFKFENNDVAKFSRITVVKIRIFPYFGITGKRVFTRFSVINIGSKVAYTAHIIRFFIAGKNRERKQKQH